MITAVAMKERAADIRVIVIEDDAPTQKFMAAAVNSGAGLELAGTARSVEHAVALIDKEKPDAAFVDLELLDGHGVEVIRHARTHNIECIVTTIFVDERNVVDAIAAGASGYLLKGMPAEEVAQSVSSVMRGESPIDPRIARHLLKHFATPTAESSIAPPPAPTTKDQEPEVLTKREHEVLTIMSKGTTYDEAAKLTDVSINTIRAHIRHIYRKLEVNTRAEAVHLAVTRGLISL